MSQRASTWFFHSCGSLASVHHNFDTRDSVHRSLAPDRGAVRASDGMHCNVSSRACEQGVMNDRGRAKLEASAVHIDFDDTPVNERWLRTQEREDV